MSSTELSLHIITLNIPDPPDYGGMIDTYYRIKALHDLGIKIHLHCYAYGREPSPVLESFCETVHYYPRKRNFLSQLSYKPFIIKSRNSKSLLKQLLDHECPILFDGIHTTSFFKHKGLTTRTKIVRVHNIEHRYYRTLAKLESNPVKKIFYFFESIKLQWYENILKKATRCITVSPKEQIYFQEKYKNAVLIPPFHPFKQVETLTGSGKYILFHGDLSVNENIKTCTWLIQNVFSHTDCLCLVAGKNPPVYLREMAKEYVNIIIIENPTNERMHVLIQEAQLLVVMALKANGFKLKLLYALFSGRFCLVNRNLIHATGLESLCSVANTAPEFLSSIKHLMKQQFTDKMKSERQLILNQKYNIRKNAEQVRDILFEGIM